jgi:hypothetical protein
METSTSLRACLDVIIVHLVREHEVTAVLASSSVLSTLDFLAAFQDDSTETSRPTAPHVPHEFLAVPNPRQAQPDDDKADALLYQLSDGPDIICPKVDVLVREDPVAYALKYW